MVFFDRVSLAPPDPILGLTAAFRKDLRKNKVNLGVGLYKTEDLKTPVLNSVKTAEQMLLSSEKSKEYLAIDGEWLYLDQMGSLVFGEEFWTKQKGRIAAFQSVGGTGALKIGGLFLKEEVDHPIWISTPTWPNHRGVFLSCKLHVENYPYYDIKNHRTDFAAMLACFEALPPGTIVSLHACCHNPSGCDPTFEESKTLILLLKERQLIPFFDFAYQGFGCGIQKDAEVIRYCAQIGQEMLVAVSNAKNLSLYGERVGCLFVVAESAKIAEHITSRIKQIIRTDYSNPPMHGAEVVACVLGTPSLRCQWEAELKEMRERINRMRLELSERLSQRCPTVDFIFLKNGKGMFGFSSLSRTGVERLIAEYGIYMSADGRINVCGLNEHNIDYVVDAIATVGYGV